LTTNGIRECQLVLANPIEMNTDNVLNADEMKNKICVVKRGKCSFALKVARAERCGAVGVVVLNTASVWPFTMGDSKREGDNITIPSVMCRKDHSEILLKSLTADDQNKKDTSGSGEKKNGIGESSNESISCLTMCVDDDNRSCAVCQCDFESGDSVLRMPCPGFRHCFHVDCIMPWLKIRNTCPSCRYELPTDNKSWDQKRASERARVNAGREYWETTVS
jgi:hypothetical protein